MCIAQKIAACMPFDIVRCHDCYRTCNRNLDLLFEIGWCHVVYSQKAVEHAGKLDGLQGNSPLHYAALMNLTNVAAVLVSHGADRHAAGTG